MTTNQVQRVLRGLALVAAFALSASAQATSSLTIVSNGTKTVLSAADFKKLPRSSVRVLEEKDSAKVSGVSLWTILEKATAVSPQASGRQRAATIVRLTGTDGFMAVVALVEVDPSFSRRVVLIADEREGKPLDAVEGPWRSIVPDDQRHGRWVRNLATITVETLK